VDRDAVYRMGGKNYTYDELADALESEAAGLDPEQWVDGYFEVHGYIAEACLVGVIERVDPDNCG
jgi:hypothetical protein